MVRFALAYHSSGGGAIGANDANRTEGLDRLAAGIVNVAVNDVFLRRRFDATNSNSNRIQAVVMLLNASPSPSPPSNSNTNLLSHLTSPPSLRYLKNLSDPAEYNALLNAVAKGLATATTTATRDDAWAAYLAWGSEEGVRSVGSIFGDADPPPGAGAGASPKQAPNNAGHSRRREVDLGKLREVRGGVLEVLRGSLSLASCGGCTPSSPAPAMILARLCSDLSSGLRSLSGGVTAALFKSFLSAIEAAILATTTGSPQSIGSVNVNPPLLTLLQIGVDYHLSLVVMRLLMKVVCRGRLGVMVARGGLGVLREWKNRGGGDWAPGEVEEDEDEDEDEDGDEEKLGAENDNHDKTIVVQMQKPEIWAATVTSAFTMFDGVFARR